MTTTKTTYVTVLPACRGIPVRTALEVEVFALKGPILFVVLRDWCDYLQRKKSVEARMVFPAIRLGKAIVRNFASKCVGKDNETYTGSYEIQTRKLGAASGNH